MSKTTSTTHPVKVENRDGKWLVHTPTGEVAEYTTRAKARSAATSYRNGEAPTVWPVDGPPVAPSPRKRTKPTPTPAPEVPEVDYAAMPYRELAELARNEHEQVKAARAGKFPHPPTPATAAMTERYGNGERFGTAPRTTSTPRVTSVTGREFGVVTLPPEVVGTTPAGFAAHPDRDGVLRIHRAECKRMPTSAEPLTTPLPEQVSIPTCCKPRIPAPAPTAVAS